MNTEILIATIGVFLGEFYGNFVGGGSIVTQIALQNILGMDIKRAMALDNAAVIGSNIGMLLIMIRKYPLKWWFVPYVLCQGIGAFLGAWILVQIDPELLKMIFIIAIVLLVLKNIFIKDGENNAKGFKETTGNYVLLFLAAIFIGTYNAAFVIGDWIIALLILTSAFSFKYHYAIFIMCFASVFAQITAVYHYHQNGLLDMNFLIPMFVATVVGGLICATLLEKIHSEKLEKFLKYLSILLVGYLIYGIL